MNIVRDKKKDYIRYLHLILSDRYLLGKFFNWYSQGKNGFAKVSTKIVG